MRRRSVRKPRPALGSGAARPVDDDDDLDKPKKVTRKAKIRLAVALAIGLAATGAWVYVRYLAPKAGLGGPCRYAMNCTKDAPKCMRPSIDEDGVCSRPCEPDHDCAPDIKCVKIELEEYDDRGVPLQGGYCFPQSFLDAKKRRPARDAGPPQDSWVDVPQGPGTVEGEIVLKWEKGGVTKGDPKGYVLKGTLLRAAAVSGKTRTIVDTAALRVYQVDDDKKTFAPQSIDPLPGDATITKTGTKDRVAERECEVWKIDDGPTQREACILQGAAYVDPGARTVAPWLRELSVRGAFPLRVIETGAGGREVSRMTAVRFDAHPVDPALFAIPKSYKNLAAR